MKKLKRWLYEQYLPTRLKDTLLHDLEKKEEENQRLRQRLETEKAYSAGLETALRYQRRITVNMDGRRKEEKEGENRGI